MEKFIRTKDGIYESTGKPNEISITNNVLYSCWDENGENEIIIRDNDIINQSDNLAELCDGFVVVPYNGSKPLVFPNVVKTMEQINKITGNVYGAIWTDKGLIYVAKMNSEGVLCLI